MPSNYARIPIYFEYDSSHQINDSSLTHPPPLSSMNPVLDKCSFSSSTCQDVRNDSFSYITGTIDLLSQQTQWYRNPELRIETEIPPLPQSFLTPNKKYFLNIMLVLPESQINTEIGMFMTNVHLYTPREESGNYSLLAYSKRSAMLPYESPMVRFVRKLLLIGPLILGVFPEAKSIEVKSFNHFVENELSPLVSFLHGPVKKMALFLSLPPLNETHCFYIHFIFIS